MGFASIIEEERLSEIKDVYTFIDLLTGYQPAMVIMAAQRLAIFDSLGRQPKSLAELASELGVDAPACGSLLESLVALGLAGGTADGYTATQFTSERLTGGSDMALVIGKEAFLAEAWLSLDGAVRSGTPVLAPWRSRLADDPGTAHQFLDALNVLALHTGPQPWTFPELAPGRSVLDVGGGFGHYARNLVEAGSTVVLVDYPETIAAARERLEDVPGVSLDFVGVDLMAARSCGVEIGSMDGALVSHMLHDLSVEHGTELLKNVSRALKPGGALVVNDFAGDSGPGAFGPLFDVMMRVETGGAAYPLDVLVSTVEAAGFRDVVVVDLPEPLTVIKGIRV